MPIGTLPPPPAELLEKKKKPSPEGGLPPPPPSLLNLPPPPAELTQPMEQVVPEEAPAPGRKTSLTPEDLKRINKQGYVSQEDIERVAKVHGVDPETLRDIAPFYNAKVGPRSVLEALEIGAKGTLGFIGTNVALHAPQKAYKEAQTPEMQAALDDISDIADAQESVPEFLAGMAAPGGVVKLGKGVALGAASLAATGAASGYFQSREGEEVESAVKGAIAAPAIVGAGAVGLKVAGATAEMLAKKLGKKAVDELPEVERKLIEVEMPKLEEGAERILQEKAASENIIKNAVLNKDVSLDEDKVSKILTDNFEPDTLQKALDPDTLSYDNYVRYASKEFSDLIKQNQTAAAIEQYMAKGVIDDRARNFATFLTKEEYKKPQEAWDALEEWAERQGGKQALEEAYAIFNKMRAGVEHATLVKGRGSRGDVAAERGLNAISDAQFVLQDIGDRFGLPLNRAHQLLNQQINRMSNARKAFQGKVEDIRKAAAKTQVDDTVVNTTKIYDALDTGKTDGLSEAELGVFDKFKAYFDDSLNFVNKLVTEKDPTVTPLSIPKRTNYVPKMFKSTPELMDTFNRKLVDAVDEINRIRRVEMGEKFVPVKTLSDISDREFNSLLNQNTIISELYNGLKLLRNADINTIREFNAAYHDTFMTSSGKSRMETKARSAIERGDVGAPDWMLEKNLYKLADKWSSNTLKHLYLRKPMAEMRAMSRMIEATSGTTDSVEARYINILLQDIVGVRAGTFASTTNNLKLNYLRKVDQLAEGKTSAPAKAAAAALKAVPEILEDLNRQIYPNLLGLSPKAIIMNSTQVLAKTAPELGTKYGYATAARAGLHLLLNFKQQVRKVEQLGLAPAEYNEKYRRAIAEGIRRSSLYAIPMDVLNKMGDAAMFLYSRMDTINRAWSLSMSEMMAHDLMRPNNRLAMGALRRLPPDVQQMVRAAPTQAAKAEAIALHLNARTQYNYNRASMSEFGRTMGPFFSTFSKWPTATAGEIIHDYRQKGVFKGSAAIAEKFLAPYLMLKSFDYILSGEWDPEERSDLYKKIVGSRGLEGSAPLGSVMAIITGDFFSPPAIDAALQGVLLPLFQDQKLMDPERGLGRAVGMFAPGAVYVRFLTDDLVTMLTGQQPEGSTFIEKTQSGFRELTR